MNKIISTDERVFMVLVGLSGCGKSYLIYEMLKNKTFYPKFDKIIYFYKYYQNLYDRMLTDLDNIEFIETPDFELIENLPNDGTNYLIIFDDSCEEISKSKEFNQLATAGRHRKLNCLYIKHNLYHKNSGGRDAELQNTHIVLFKSPRDVQQIGVLGKQIGLGKQLVYWYNDATAKPYGHLMIDLSPRTPDILRFSTNSTSFPSLFFLPNSKVRTTEIDDNRAELLYAKALSRIQAEPPKNCPPELFQGIY